MLIIEATASLNIVKGELDESLRLSESFLEQYLEEPENDGRMLSCMEPLIQVRGVLRLIELRGAALLADEIIALVNAVLAREVRDRDQALGILSGALMVLGKYLEYSQLQQQSLPVLLIPVINDIRPILKKPLLPESEFTVLPGARDVELPLQTPGELPDHARLIATVRRLRHLYQVGMLGVFQGNPLATHAKMMNRALTRLQSLSGEVPLATLWWLGRGVTEVMAEAQVSVTTPRKRLLGMIDRQIKTLEAEGAKALQEFPPENIVRECLHLIALANHPGELASQICSSFLLDPARMRDEEFSHHLQAMAGPGGTAIRAVVDALKEEISYIKEQLDLGARGGQGDEDSYSRIADSLSRIANTVQLLGQQDGAMRLKSRLEIVRGWDSKPVDGNSQEFQEVADALLYVENSVAMMLPRISGTLSATGAEMEDMRRCGISVSHLDEARKLLVGESRAGLSLAKRAITSYLESNGDGTHLENVPTTLKTVWGGLVFLHFTRAAEVLRSCEDFIAERLISEHSTIPDPHIMETLADAITSVDYYLESMEDNKPMGDGILEVAEESMQELGYPVKAT